MNIAQPHSIEDHIFKFLQKGALPIVDLIQLIEKARPGTTKQGVYLVIRRLREQEIVVVHKKSISLSSVWLTAMSEFLAQAQYNTQHITSSGNSFLDLKQGEKLQYYFKNPILTDAFWSHVFLTLVESSAPQSPVLIYNPHEWFLLARTENEVDLFKRIANRGQKLAVLIGNNSTLDKSVRVHFDGKNSLYETLSESPYPKTNYYINVIGDFVIEVWIDMKVSSEIDLFYKEINTFDDIQKQKLNAILMQKGKNKFSITHNKRKADMIRGKFKKYFFL